MSFVHPCLSKAQKKTEVAETQAVVAVNTRRYTKRSPPHRRLSPAGTKSIETRYRFSLPRIPLSATSRAFYSALFKKPLSS
jgi:hypothetical protein